MSIRTLPPNVTEGVSGSPTVPPEKTPQAEAYLRFPVSNHRPSLIQDLFLFAVSFLLIAGIATQQFFFYTKQWALDFNSLTYTVIPFVGTLFLFSREAFRSWPGRIAVLVAAMFINILAFVASDWVYHWAFGLIAFFYFLDQFFLHAVSLRFNAINDSDLATTQTVLNRRILLNDSNPINLLSYLYPLVVLAVISFGARTNLDQQLEITRQVSGKRFFSDNHDYLDPRYSTAELTYFLFLLAALVLAPIAFDYLARFFRLPSFGLKRLLSEFRSAIGSWFTYNTAFAMHPAVLQSAAGNALERKLMFLGTMLFLVPISMPTQLFVLQMDETEQRNIDSEKRFFERGDAARSRQAYERELKFIAYAPQLQKLDGKQFDFDAPISQGDEDSPLLSQFSDRFQQSSQSQAQPPEEDARLDELWKQRSVPVSRDPTYIILGIPNLILWILGPFMPVVVLLTGLFAASARSMAYLTDQLGPIPNRDCLTPENWGKIVAKLQADSPSEILWGADARDQAPVVIPNAVLREHVHFLGDTGSGKTSLGISPLLAQLVSSKDCSLVVIDLKGDDQSLFELLRIGAAANSSVSSDDLSSSKRWSYPFAYFSSNHRFASHVFNPFSQSAFRELSPIQKTDLITTSLGLQYGSDYGRKYFGDSNFSALQQTLERFPNVSSFSELYDCLKDTVQTLLDRETRQASTNLLMSVHRLSHLPALNHTTDDNQASEQSSIELGDLFSRPQAVYFSLPSATGSVVNADLGRLVLFALINAAQHAQKPRKQVFLVIDEFQRLVSNHIAVILQMARGLDIGVILSNQSMSDLNQTDARLLSTVTTNTRIRQIFGLSDPNEIRQLIDVAGEQSLFLRTFTETVNWLSLGFSLKSRSHSETISPRIRTNDIIEASDNPTHSIFTMRRGTGNAKFGGYPFIIQSTFHITVDEYERRVLTPWPPPNNSARNWQLSSFKEREQPPEETSKSIDKSATTASKTQANTNASSSQSKSVPPASNQAIEGFVAMLDGLAKRQRKPE